MWPEAYCFKGMSVFRKTSKWDLHEADTGSVWSLGYIFILITFNVLCFSITETLWPNSLKGTVHCRVAFMLHASDRPSSGRQAVATCLCLCMCVGQKYCIFSAMWCGGAEKVEHVLASWRFFLPQRETAGSRAECHLLPDHYWSLQGRSRWLRPPTAHPLPQRFFA